MSGIHGVSLADVDTHWLKWAVPLYIKSYEYMPAINTWVVVDNNGMAHTVPADLLLNQNTKVGPRGDELPLWIFRIYLTTDWPEYTPKTEHYATVKDEVEAIQKELDIYRGVAPTPKGYKANPQRVKLLMQRLARLKKENPNE